jgi:hypothetical protein
VSHQAPNFNAMVASATATDSFRYDATRMSAAPGRPKPLTRPSGAASEASVGQTHHAIVALRSCAPRDGMRDGKYPRE